MSFKKYTTSGQSKLPTFERNNRLFEPSLYRPAEELADAVNVALTLGQPLLLTGAPGTGKTQMARPFRKPLIVMSPKSGLRHPQAVSGVEDFYEGTRFQEILDDPNITTAKAANKVKRLLLCSGKIYFDLSSHKEENQRDDVAVVRLEQLYPFPAEQLNKLFKKYGKAEHTLWVQEEPANMGAWQYVNSMRYSEGVELPDNLNFVARKTSASPATGFKKVHDQEQQSIVDRAFGNK